MDMKLDQIKSSKQGIQYFGILYENGDVKTREFTNQEEYDLVKKEPNVKNISELFKAQEKVHAYLAAHRYFKAPIMRFKE